MVFAAFSRTTVGVVAVVPLQKNGPMPIGRIRRMGRPLTSSGVPDVNPPSGPTLGVLVAVGAVVATDGVVTIPSTVGARVVAPTGAASDGVVPPDAGAGALQARAALSRTQPTQRID